MGKIIFIRNKDNAFVSVNGITRTITNSNTLLLSDIEIVKNTLEGRGLVGKSIKQISNSEYSYQ